MLLQTLYYKIREAENVRKTASNALCPYSFSAKDILIANIRPYLKKIWFADIEGGCSSDVLVFRAKEGHFPNFLYATLMQDSFYDYVMKGVKGSKMPRGDKEQIMRYKMPTFSSDEEQNIGKIVVDIEKKLQLSRALNDNLPMLDRSLGEVGAVTLLSQLHNLLVIPYYCIKDWT